jgi:hypothetical protein
MKKIIIVSLVLITWVSGFSQTRDHRSGGNRGSRASDLPPTPPPPVAGKHKPGPPVTTIDPNKWYYIKKTGTEKYMEISGHKDRTRSMAYLALENMQQESISLQWRFVAVGEESGNTIYKIENRKFQGFLNPTRTYLFMESRLRRVDESQIFRAAFVMMLNTDKSWFILTRVSENRRALATEIKNSSHCQPYEADAIIGGKVRALADCECTKDMRREYVTAHTIFTGQDDQKWTLEEVRER